MAKQFDCGGYASKYNIKCGDGRTIMPGAFKEMDGVTVPLVWQHLHNEPDNVLGHGLIKHLDDGPYLYISFNDTDAGKKGKALVKHGDIDSLSIYANGLIEKNKIVAHGVIREVSLVLAGANPGAKIDYIAIEHGDGSIVNSDEEAVIYSGLKIDFEEEKKEVKEEKEIKHEDSEKTIGDVFDSLSEEQKTAVYAIIGAVIDGEDTVEQSEKEDEEKVMKHNIFENDSKEKVVKHTLTKEQFGTIMADARKLGSLKASFLSHAGDYGIDNISVLFPDAQGVGEFPTFVKRDMEWVPDVINGTKHSPFSRIKSASADITVDTARARGYVTGNLKKEEVFALLSRSTTPTTVYKKQKLDRDDIIDITDMDVVAWLKAEMRMMLDEELARAVLVGDGRELEDEDKIDETCIRPIWTEAELYVYNVLLESDDDMAEIEEAIIRSRKYYKGSGSPVMYTTTDFLTDLLLQKDAMERRLYNTEAELAAALRVSRIVEVPVMDNLSRTVGEELVDRELRAIIVNLKDYTMGADKGGQVSMFDDFDIDYNQYKYLMETRCSGALVVPKSAIIIEQKSEVSV